MRSLKLSDWVRDQAEMVLMSLPSHGMLTVLANAARQEIRGGRKGSKLSLFKGDAIVYLENLLLPRVIPVLPSFTVPVTIPAK